MTTVFQLLPSTSPAPLCLLDLAGHMHSEGRIICRLSFSPSGYLCNFLFRIRDFPRQMFSHAA